MATVSVSVTEFSRGLSEFLSHVQYQGQVLNIERGGRIIARVSPVTLTDGFPIDQLDDFLAKGPQLDAGRKSQIANRWRRTCKRYGRSCAIGLLPGQNNGRAFWSIPMFGYLLKNLEARLV